MRLNVSASVVAVAIAASALTAPSATAAQIGPPSRAFDGEMNCTVTLDAGEQAYFNKIKANVSTPAMVESMKVAHRAAYPEWNEIAERLDRIPGYRMAMVNARLGTATESQWELLERALASEGLTVDTKGTQQLMNHSLIAAARTNPSVLDLSEIPPIKLEKVTTAEPPALPELDIAYVVLDSTKMAPEHHPVARKAVETTAFYKAFTAYLTEYETPLRNSYRACAQGGGIEIPYPTSGLASDLSAIATEQPSLPTGTGTNNDTGTTNDTGATTDTGTGTDTGDGAGADKSQTVIIAVSVVVALLAVIGLVAAAPLVGITLPFTLPFELPLSSF